MFTTKSGNCLVDRFESDKSFHYPDENICLHCDTTGWVYSVKDWISAAREANYLEYEGNNFKTAMSECHFIIKNGKTECPSCNS